MSTIDNFPRSSIIKFSLIFLSGVLIVRLFFLQILNDELKILADNNIKRCKDILPSRGIIKDRNGNVLVDNQPLFDVTINKKYIKYIDINDLCSSIRISLQTFEELNKKPSSEVILLSNITEQQLSQVSHICLKYKYINIVPHLIREYKKNILSNVIGYMKFRDKNGFSHGATGLELQYDDKLSGKIGKSYNVADVHGKIIGKYKNGELDVDVIHGEDLQLTIDADLQEYGENLIQDKVGSIVVIQPQTGEILTLVSSPTYPPNLLKQIGTFSENYKIVLNIANMPLLNRCISCTYPPGSIFKLIQSIIGLDLKSIDTNLKLYCNTTKIKCHNHPNPVDVRAAIAYSCNYFFLYNFQQLLVPHNDETLEDRLSQWTPYVYKFGLGNTLGVDIPNEKKGFIPSVEYYNKLYGIHRWKASTIRSLDIGQGELLVTPLQLANLACTIANRGFYFTPHINKELKVTKNIVDINDKYYDVIIDGMYDSVRYGSSWRADIPGIKVYGKTGTAQNGTDNDHSIFVGFTESPPIAVAVYLEHQGWGAQTAASTFKQIVQYYITNCYPH